MHQFVSSQMHPCRPVPPLPDLERPVGMLVAEVVEAKKVGSSWQNCQQLSHILWSPFNVTPLQCVVPQAGLSI